MFCAGGADGGDRRQDPRRLNQLPHLSRHRQVLPRHLPYLRRRHRGAVILAVDATGDEVGPPSLDDAPEPLVGIRKEHRLERPAQVFERQKLHQLAASRTDPLG